MVSTFNNLWSAAMGIVLSAQFATFASAQILMKELPPGARGIDVEDRVGQFIPLDLIFNDERGNRIGLAKFFRTGKPIILTLNYSDCPGLCIAQLENLVSTLREPEAKGLGEDFDIITVSIDPTEPATKAARTKQKYLDLLREPGAQQGWHFLTGNQESIARLADSVGFRYTFDKATGRYNHAAATYFISSDGRICRYLLSLGTEPAQFRLAVAEAAQGKLNRTLSDVIMQLCYVYDPLANRYTASARRLLSFCAGIFVVMIFAGCAPFWFSKSGATKRPASQSSDASIGKNEYSNEANK